MEPHGGAADGRSPQHAPSPHCSSLWTVSVFPHPAGAEAGASLLRSAIERMGMQHHLLFHQFILSHRRTTVCHSLVKGGVRCPFIQGRQNHLSRLAGIRRGFPESTLLRTGQLRYLRKLHGGGQAMVETLDFFFPLRCWNGTQRHTLASPWLVESKSHYRRLVWSS